MTFVDQHEILEWGKEALLNEAEALRKAADRLGDTFFQAVSVLLNSPGKLVVTGLGKSGHVGRKIASTLSSTGTSAAFLHPSEALHGDFGMLQKVDSLMAIAYGGETHEVIEVARFARRMGIQVIVLTGQPYSTLAQLGSIVISVHVDQEADPLNLAPTCSSTLTMAMGDALAVALMSARRFTPVDFASLHPGGSLGRRLSLVRDLMHAGDSLPKVAAEADFHHVLEAVTVDNFGIAAVVSKDGDLMGAISDGDLRRALLSVGAKTLSCHAMDLMSQSPKVIVETALAIDAVKQMNDQKISRLFVVSEKDHKKVLGLVRLQDLLAAKIL
jgi:arabinose-5-phosphate isomerase